jgi:hypothetical protein
MGSPPDYPVAEICGGVFMSVLGHVADYGPGKGQA